MTDFFFTVDPELYDLSLPFVVPGVRSAQAIRRKFFAELFPTASEWVGVDVGIGTGSDLVALLPQDAAGTVYGIDDSAPLTTRIRATGRLASLPRVDLCLNQADFTTTANFETIRRRYPRGMDFANSSFAIHNVPAPQQAVAFSGIASLLAPGAPFLYLDLIGYQDRTLQRLADAADIEFIEVQMAVVPDQADPVSWHRLRERWIKHYREENFIVPLTAASEPSIVGMFKAAGLSAPEILYREHNTTLLLARRTQ